MYALAYKKLPRLLVPPFSNLQNRDATYFCHLGLLEIIVNGLAYN